VFGEREDLRIIDWKRPQPAAGLFDWYVKPHLNSRDIPRRTISWCEEAAAGQPSG
jgi:hypothetical protein